MAKMDLNGDDEKVNIETIFWSAMDMLSDDDKKLPQVSFLFTFILVLSKMQIKCLCIMRPRNMVDSGYLWC